MPRPLNRKRCLIDPETYPYFLRLAPYETEGRVFHLIEIEVISHLKTLIRHFHSSDALNREDSAFTSRLIPPNNVQAVILIPQLVRIEPVLRTLLASWGSVTKVQREVVPDSVQ